LPRRDKSANIYLTPVCLTNKRTFFGDCVVSDLTSPGGTVVISCTINPRPGEDGGKSPKIPGGMVETEARETVHQRC